MTDPRSRDPGERRLARPPSERYAEVPSAADVPPAGGSIVRATVFGDLAALGLAVAIAVVGGLALITAGLIVVAAAGGWLVGVAVRTGLGGLVVAPFVRVLLAVGSAVAGVLVGQLGLWLIARAEGGVLDPVQYVAETFGILVPIQLAAAAIAGWLATR